MARFASLLSALATAPTTPLTAAEQRARRGATAEQEAAIVAAGPGVLVVAATAGSGKTRVLTERVAALLRAGVAPTDILVSTFTRAAAQQLQRRLQALGVTRAALPYCGTLHALALSLLGGPTALATRGARLLTAADWSDVLPELQALAPPAYAELSPREWLALLQRHDEQDRQPAALYPSLLAWAEWRRAHGCWDFAWLLREAVQAPPRRQFRHLLVDEAQDLSALQQQWLAQVSAADATTFLVGDDDQAIYAFRGAGAGVLAQQAAQARTVLPLSCNHRSATRIVAAAQRLLARVPGRVMPAVTAARTDPGALQITVFPDLAAELAAVSAWHRQHPQGCILGRTHAVLAPFAARDLPVATIHEAKGQEWPAVWLTGCEVGRLPHPLGAPDEERRLLYVAMTRARDQLTLAWTPERQPGQTSRPCPWLADLASPD